MLQPLLMSFLNVFGIKLNTKMFLIQLYCIYSQVKGIDIEGERC